MRTRELSPRAVHRLIARTGMQRIGKDATKEMGKTLEEISERISKKAVELASHAGRKTIKAKDIRLAFRDIVRE